MTWSLFKIKNIGELLVWNFLVLCTKDQRKRDHRWHIVRVVTFEGCQIFLLIFCGSKCHGYHHKISKTCLMKIQLQKKLTVIAS